MQVVVVFGLFAMTHGVNVRKYRNFVYIFLNLCILLALPSIALAGAGGTSGSCGSSEGTGIFGLIFLILLGPALLGKFFYFKFIEAYSSYRANKVAKEAVRTHKYWKIDQHFIQKIFLNMQILWSEKDRKGSTAYLHPDYQQYYFHQMKISAENGLKNIISNIEINQIKMTFAQKFFEDDKDQFTVFIQGTMDDGVYDSDGHIRKYLGDKKGKLQRKIDEYWSFRRDDGAWKLSNIRKRNIHLNDVSFNECLTADKTGASRLKSLRRFQKTLFRSVALLIAGLIALIGYYLYYKLGIAILSSIQDLLHAAFGK